MVVLGLLLSCNNEGPTDDGYHGDFDQDGYRAAVDCNDGDPDVHPSAAEVCNNVDDNCDGEVDNDAVDAVEWYIDKDNDGWGATEAIVLCSKRRLVGLCGRYAKGGRLRR